MDKEKMADDLRRLRQLLGNSVDDSYKYVVYGMNTLTGEGIPVGLSNHNEVRLVDNWEQLLGG